MDFTSGGKKLAAVVGLKLSGKSEILQQDFEDRSTTGCGNTGKSIASDSSQTSEVLL